MAYKVTLNQIELLLQFLEQHRPLGLGRVRGREGNLLSQRMWQRCADSLNSEAGGAVKSAKDWKTVSSLIFKLPSPHSNSIPYSHHFALK